MRNVTCASNTIASCATMLFDLKETICRCYYSRHNFDHKIKALEFIDKHSYDIMNGLLLFIMILKSTFAIFALIALLIYMRPVPDPNIITLDSLKSFLKNALFLVSVLFVENSLVYFVSYYDDNKFNYTASQDHLYNILVNVIPWWTELFDNLRPYFTFPGADDYLTFVLLWALAALMGRIRALRVNTFRWAAIFVRSLGYARIVRTIGFVSTVLPNPQPDCFINKFEMYQDTSELLSIIFTIRISGCNDLVVSGHTLFICMLVYLINQVTTGWSIKVVNFITPFVLLDIVMGRHHYSVDVFLAIVISYLIWDRESLRNESFFKELEAKEGENMAVKNDIRRSLIELGADV